MAKSQIVPCTYYTYRIWKRSNDYWYADGVNNDVDLRRESLRTTDKQAAIEELRRIDVLNAVDYGLIDPAEVKGKSNPDIPLDEVRHKYADSLAVDLKLKDKRPATKKKYLGQLNTFLKFLEDSNCSYWRCNKEMQKSFLSKRASEGLSKKTLKLDYEQLGRMIKFMKEEFGYVERTKYKFKARISKEPKRYCPTTDELKRCFQLMRSKGDNWAYHAWRFLSLTGMRVGEAEQLTWSDVDFVKEVIYVRDDEHKTTKGKRSRVVPMLPMLKELLEEIGIRKSTDHVLCSARGCRLNGDRLSAYIRKYIRPILVEEYPDSDVGNWVTHSLRHYYVSLCLEQGLPPHAVMKIVGHNSSDMIWYYYHLNDQNVKEQMSGFVL